MCRVILLLLCAVLFATSFSVFAATDPEGETLTPSGPETVTETVDLTTIETLLWFIFGVLCVQTGAKLCEAFEYWKRG